MKLVKNSLLLLIAAVILFAGCDSNNGGNKQDYIANNRVLILNQGNFESHDGSICLYDEDTKDFIPDIYSSANNGAKIGSTIMSGTFTVGGAGYLLCANPDKIIVINLANIQAVNTLEDANGIISPREIAVGGSYLFVTNAGNEYTDLGTGYREYTKSFVSIYEISNIIPKFVTKIDVGSDAQGLAFFDNTLYVATKDGIATIEKEGLAFVKRSTYKDQEFTGAVKYLCITNNKLYASVPGYGVYEFDPYDKKTRKRYKDLPLDWDGYITSDLMGYVYSFATTYGQNWEVVSSGAYQLNPSNGTIATVIQGKNIFSVGASPYSGNIFTSEANGFVTNSTVNIVKGNDFSKVDSQTAGIGTFRYLFYSYITPKN